MKNIIKRQLANTKLIKSMTTWSFMILVALAICFVTGCRIFTIGD